MATKPLPDVTKWKYSSSSPPNFHDMFSNKQNIPSSGIKIRTNPMATFNVNVREVKNCKEFPATTIPVFRLHLFFFFFFSFQKVFEVFKNLFQNRIERRMRGLKKNATKIIKSHWILSGKCKSTVLKNGKRKTHNSARSKPTSIHHRFLEKHCS